MAISASTVGLPEDKAYISHHFKCPTCIAAGATPGKQARCPDGQRLWELYLQAFQAQATTSHPLKKQKAPRGA